MLRTAALFESTRAHQENACVEIHERFSFAQTANSRRRVDLNSIGRRYPSRQILILGRDGSSDRLPVLLFGLEPDPGWKDDYLHADR